MDAERNFLAIEKRECPRELYITEGAKELEVRDCEIYTFLPIDLVYQGIFVQLSLEQWKHQQLLHFRDASCTGCQIRSIHANFVEVQCTDSLDCSIQLLIEDEQFSEFRIQVEGADLRRLLTTRSIDHSDGELFFPLSSDMTLQLHVTLIPATFSLAALQHQLFTCVAMNYRPQ